VPTPYPDFGSDKFILSKRVRMSESTKLITKFLKALYIAVLEQTHCHVQILKRILLKAERYFWAGLTGTQERHS
jgi:hypothetical protein